MVLPTVVDAGVNLPVSRDTLTREQMELLKRTICKGASDDELALFMEVARRTGLDPFRREIYAIKRRTQVDGKWEEQMVIQTGIDGVRGLAETSGHYTGQVGPEWCGPDGKWRDVWLADEPPAAARVGALRDDCREPIWGIARYVSYVQTNREGEPTRFWKSMPDLMIAKCAESLALRRAFPRQLSGLYIPEEIRDEDPVLSSPKQPQRASLPTPRPQPQRQMTPLAELQLAAREYRGGLTGLLREYAPDAVNPNGTYNAARLTPAKIAELMAILREATSGVPPEQPAEDSE